MFCFFLQTAIAWGEKLTFRESYGISSQLVNFAEKNDKTLDKISLEEQYSNHNEDNKKDE